MATPAARARRLIRPVSAPATRPPPLDGAWAPRDTRLDGLDLFPLPTGAGPEDVAVDAEGRLVAGANDGRIWRWPADPAPGTPPETIAETGGRPLGIELDPRDGSLVVCDAQRGLLRLTGDGRLHELCREAAGVPVGVCNNAAVAPDGTVYFSDSSVRYPLGAWKKDLLEYRPNGRLLAWSPTSRRADVVADGLYFPNGVALTPDRSVVLVCETTRHRLLRVPLGGAPVVLADLPAYPDNMSAVGDGTYWIALPSPRVAVAERLLPHPRIRQVVALLPDRVQPQPKRYGLVALVDGDGTVLRTLHGPAGRYAMITGVRQHGDALWLGSLTEGAVARVPREHRPSRTVPDATP
jgi:sugar lactone lactonase YvrE